MNILIVPSWYPTEEKPLNGSFFREQAIALSQCGHNVIVLNVTFTSKHSYFNKKNFKHVTEQDNGIIVYSFVIPSFGLSRKKYFHINVFRHNMFKVFSKIKKEYDIDIIHAHSYMPAGIASCDLGEKYNIPVVVTEHSSSVIKKNISNTELKYLKETVRKSNKFICVSEKLKKSVLELLDEEIDIEVVPNLVSPLFGINSSNKNNEKKENFTFISVGNLIEGKRPQLTIDSFKNAFVDNPNVKLEIVGDGPLKSKLEKQIKKLNMQGQIYLIGSLSRHDTALQVTQSDAFVLASSFETFGIAFIEALACGKPVIGTYCGGPEDIISKSNGLIVPVDDSENLTQAMLEIYRNKERYDPLFISLEVLRKYSPIAVSKQLTDIYMNILYEKTNGVS